MRKTGIVKYHNDTVQVPTHTFILAIDNRPTEKGLETPQIIWALTSLPGTRVRYGYTVKLPYQHSIY